MALNPDIATTPPTPPMPSVIPFRKRQRTPAEELLELVLAECFDVTWSKGDRSWRYCVRPGKYAGEWYCQVWLGDKSQHRGEVTNEYGRVRRLRAEFFREMRELEVDGWSISAGADPRPRTPLGR
jgi:hypothetical protein